MAKDKFIKMDGASVNVAHVLSFSTEKEFVDACDDKLYQHREQKARKALLKSLYKLAKKQENELPGSTEGDNNIEVREA
jgi:hypothetical protein